MNKYLLTAMNWENLTISELDQNVESFIENRSSLIDNFDVILHLCRSSVRLRTSFSILESHVHRPSTAYYNDNIDFTKKNMNFHGFKDIFNQKISEYFSISNESEEDYLNKIKEMNSD